MPLKTKYREIGGYLAVTRQFPEGSTKPGLTSAILDGFCSRCTYCTVTEYGWCSLVFPDSNLRLDEIRDAGLKRFGPDWDMVSPDMQGGRA